MAAAPLPLGVVLDAANELAVEALPTETWILLPMVWLSHGRKDDVYVVEQPRPTSREMQMRACIENDDAAVGIGRLVVWRFQGRLNVCTPAQRAAQTATAPARTPVGSR